jgi:hypothetical protein
MADVDMHRRCGTGNGGGMHIGLSDETIEAMAETAKMKKTNP